MRVASGHEGPTAGSGASPRERAELPATTVALGVPSQHRAESWLPFPSLLFLLPVLLRAQLCQPGVLWPLHQCGTRKWEGKHGVAHTKARLWCVGRQEGVSGSLAPLC